MAYKEEAAVVCASVFGVLMAMFLLSLEFVTELFGRKDKNEEIDFYLCRKMATEGEKT